jgi:hypothetical protein
MDRRAQSLRHRPPRLDECMREVEEMVVVELQVERRSANERGIEKLSARLTRGNCLRLETEVTVFDRSLATFLP